MNIFRCILWFLLFNGDILLFLLLLIIFFGGDFVFHVIEYVIEAKFVRYCVYLNRLWEYNWYLCVIGNVILYGICVIRRPKFGSRYCITNGLGNIIYTIKLFCRFQCRS